MQQFCNVSSTSGKVICTLENYISISVRGDHCHQQRARCQTHPADSQAPLPRPRRGSVSSTLLSTLIPGHEEREAAAFLALRHAQPVDTPPHLEQELHKRPTNMQDIQKTACELSFAVFAKASAGSSACWLAPPVAWQPSGHPTFL